MEMIVALDGLEDFARKFWQQVAESRVFAFYGDMGAGKTTIIESLCREKGVRDHMSSPTFSIINEYVFEEGGKERTVFHIDLYRLETEAEVIQSGVEDCIFGTGICFVEWPEKAPFLFDEKTVYVHIEPIDAATRKVKLDLPSLV